MLPALLAGFSMVPDGFTVTPDIHGDKVVYSSEGDLWIGSLSTMRAERLTSDEGREFSPQFSPDGTQIAFQAQYDGMTGVYVMDSDGGAPRKVAFTQSPFNCPVYTWTADGKSVCYGIFGSPSWFKPYKVPARGGAPEALPLEFVSNIDWGPSGDDYTFTRFPLANDSWFRYIGGMQNQIWTHHAGKFQQITTVDGHSEYPAWVGNDVYFINEQNATFRLMKVPSTGGNAKVVAGPYDVPLRNLSGDQSRLVYEKGNGLEMYTPATNSVEALKLARTSDKRHTAPFFVAADRLAGSPAMTPGAKRVFLESRGQIISLPVGEGEARVWKAKAGVRLRYPLVSPDGKKVAYWSDETSEVQITVADMDGSHEKTLTSGKSRQLTLMQWSPDSKWILFADSNADLSTVDVSSGATSLVANVPLSAWNGKSFDISPDSKWITYTTVLDKGSLNQVMLYNVTAAKTERVSSGMTNDSEAVFTRDGKYLAILSDRHFNVAWDVMLNQMGTSNTTAVCLLPLTADTADPFALKDASDVEPDKPKAPEGTPDVKIELDGLYDRAIELPMTGQFTQLIAGKDKVFVSNQGNVLAFDLTSKSATQVTAGRPLQVSADGSKLLVAGDSYRVVDANGSNISAAIGALNFGGLKLRIEPVAEWKQMFRDGWRHFRDYFYVANMNGVDWNAIYAKYSAMLPAVASRSELDILFRWIEGELGCSHMGVTAGDERWAKSRTAPAFLGIEVAADPSGYYKITRVYKGDVNPESRSPLAAPQLKVSEGDFLIEVAGVPAKVGEDVFSGLAGRAGQTVSVKVNSKPTDVGSRTVLVKPVADDEPMRYTDWVERNRKYVLKASGGKIGYIHMADMTPRSMSDFIKLYFGQRDKEAMIVDVRFNQGGNTQEVMNRILSASLSAFFNERNSAYSWSRQGDYFDGPMVCLMNEFNISCGEEFPYRFRELKRGKLVGRRTMGGEVGNSPGWGLADGGRVWVPNYGMYSPERGWEIEGKGVAPDIDVPSDPNAFVAGKDPQLDRAIAQLVSDLKTWPKRPIQTPKDRDRVKQEG